MPKETVVLERIVNSYPIKSKKNSRKKIFRKVYRDNYLYDHIELYLVDMIICHCNELFDVIRNHGNDSMKHVFDEGEIRLINTKCNKDGNVYNYGYIEIHDNISKTGIIRLHEIGGKFYPCWRFEVKEDRIDIEWM